MGIRQSLFSWVSGRKWLFWLVALGSVIKSGMVMLKNWWALLTVLALLYSLAMYQGISDYFVLPLMLSVFFLTVLATRSSIINKNYAYILEKKRHILVSIVLISLLYILTSHIPLPSVIAWVVLLVPRYMQYWPLLLIAVLFYFDAPSGPIFLYRSIIQSIRFVINNYPLIALLFFLFVLSDYAVVLLLSYLPDLYAQMGTVIFKCLMIAIYVPLMTTIYLHVIHEQFDAYFAPNVVTFRMVVHSLISWLLLLLVSIIFMIPLGIFLLLPQKWGTSSKAYYLWEYWYSWLIMKLTLIPIHVHGIENIPDEHAIIIANHQSSLDIPLLVTLLKGHPHVWLAHKALMRSLFLRLILPKIAVLVDTDTPMTAMRSLLSIQKIVEKSRKHIIVFPEGGRYTDGRIHDFFAGYVILAKKMKKPIVPVYIHGLNQVFPPHTIWARYVPVTVVVGESFVQLENESDEDFNNRVHAWFNVQNQKMKES